MRRKHYRDELSPINTFGLGGTKPTLPMIIILILILLQFGGGNFAGHAGPNNSTGLNVIDNGILFIIAIFFLSCGCIGKSDRCC